jgi:SAM-dependent methyltransferase
MINAVTASSLFRAMGDPVRLRLLQLLSKQELSVAELVKIVEFPQSTVSRHLRTLREEGLISDRPVGPATYYTATIEAETGNGETGLRDALADYLKASDLAPGDHQILDRILAGRAQGDEFFDRVGSRWDTLRESCFGPAFHLEAFLALLPRYWTVADLGTGTGYLLPALARFFDSVIAVDNSRQMLDLAQKRIQEAGVEHKVQLREGALEHLPIEEGEVDLAVAVLMLHHLPDISAALREVRRVMRREGRLLIVDFHEHTNETFRVQMADRRPGLGPQALDAWLAESGLVRLDMVEYPKVSKPEHELAPIPQLYAVVAGIKS